MEGRARDQRPPLNPWRTIWIAPRQTVHHALQGDAARFVISVAWLSGVLDVLQSSAMRGPVKPHWGPFVLLMALGMGPLLGFGYFVLTGSLTAGVGHLLGGEADSSETRVALACGALPGLIALPLWAPILGVCGLEIFTTARPPVAAGLLAFAGLQVALWLWSWALRLVTLAEVHDFSVFRALCTVLLSWLVGVVALVGLVFGIAALVGK